MTLANNTNDRWRVCPWRGLALLLAVAALSTLGASYWHVDAPYPLDSERFGVGLDGPAGEIELYDLEALGAGWYLNWGTAMNPPHPNAAAYMQTIRLREGQPLRSDAQITALVQANPGATWQIGNEPDSPWQDNTMPAAYAHAYHHLYHLIKSVDPTARVANGGLVQATPLRLAYLDRVWDAYQVAYGEPMPVDVWTVHGFILREKRGDWGAGIPPGMSDVEHLGRHYYLRDHDDIDIFIEQIKAFRQWMADRGQRHKPLIINEYGILMWPDLEDEEGNDFPAERVIDFMYNTFDFFLGSAGRHGHHGYPADGDRLVQAWAWYSLDDRRYRDGYIIYNGFNGDLFIGQYEKTMTAIGEAYADYVHDIVGLGQPYTDLAPLTLQADLSGVTWGQTEAVGLAAGIINHGRRPASDVTVAFWDGDPDAGGTPIPPDDVIAEVPGRFEGMPLAEVAWTTTVAGTAEIWVVVDPDDDIDETDLSNNRVGFAVDLRGDLALSALTAHPRAPLFDGNPVTVTARAEVTNLGPMRAPAGAELQFTTGNQTRIYELPALAPGETVELTTDFTFTTPGARTITATVDIWLEDRDPTNNTATTGVLVATEQIYAPVIAQAH